MAGRDPLNSSGAPKRRSASSSARPTPRRSNAAGGSRASHAAPSGANRRARGASAAPKAPKAPKTPKPSGAKRAGRAQAAPSLGEPALWTKNAPAGRGAGGASRAGGILSAIGGVLLALLRLIGRGIALIARALAALFARSRIALVAAIVVAVVLVGVAVDAGMNGNRVYAGVSVGGVDVGGKTPDEAAAALQAALPARIEGKSVTIYASDEAAAQAGDAAALAEREALAEQQSVEDAQASKLLWTTGTDDLGAAVDVQGLVNRAFAVGREDGGPFKRLQALVGGTALEPRTTYDQHAYDALVDDIDATIGVPRVDFDIAVSDGRAVVTDGHDGNLVDRASFAEELDRALFAEGEPPALIAHAEPAPLRITREAAQATCDRVNAALAGGARFAYGNASWEATPADLGSWVQTSIEAQEGGGFALVPRISYDKAKGIILNHVKANAEGEAVHVTFAIDGGQTLVNTDAQGEMPLVDEAVAALEGALFGEGGAADGGPAASVEVGTAPMPGTLTFDEAMDAGIISTISSFTTEYTSGSGTENRNHNIHLASNLLSDSVARANGGTWSFNETAGECNADKGFLGAGAIIDGEYEDAVGGGICQVATTVFNAVYDAGFPVPTRFNHSLYIASYPDGRDAAVSWPDLDLVWKNDSPSDVLVRLSYTETSVTVTLYGVDPEYAVSTEVGEWEEGEKYKTKVEVDENLAPGTSYVKTNGSNGRKISVVRTVKDRNGTVLHEDLFVSNYDPKNQVIVAAPDAADEAKAKADEARAKAAAA